MKQKDVAMILVVSFASAVLSLVVSNLLFGSQSKRNLEAPVVTAITPEFNEPEKKYFNDQSVDPTQIIRIGDNANNQPFNQQ